MKSQSLRFFLFLLLALSLGACNLSASGGSGGGGSSKKLFGIWTSASTGLMADWSNGAFNSVRPIQFIFTAGPRCECQLTIAGNESAGSYNLSSCTYTSGGNGDPGCASLNGAGNYVKQTHLTLCSGACETYH